MKRNFLDRTIGLFSPKAELNRVKARVAAEMVRGYDAARTKRRDGGWISQGSSANAEIGPALSNLRNASRELIRNNPYATRICDILVSHDIGTGIVARPRTGKKTTDKRLAETWKAWAETTECDAEGQLNLYGLQALVRRTVVESGECLIRLRYRRAEDNLSVPLQLQVLEPDYLDHMKHQTIGTGGRIVNGVEFDALDRRVAYWLHRDHPGDTLNRMGVQSSGSVRVPAGEILHIYNKKRAGQVRGIPELSAVMTKLRDVAEYHEAVLVRAKMEAAIALIVTKESPDDEGMRSLGVDEEDENGDRIQRMSPGMIEYLDPGEGIETINPTPSAGHNDFSRTGLEASAVGSGLTYHHISGDLRGANYSSLRAGTVDFKRQVEQRQWSTYIPMMCDPIWSAFVKAGYLSGKWTMSTAKADWTPPAHALTDPRKDGAALIDAVRAGAMTLPQMIAEMGYDPETQLEEIAECNKMLDKLGIILDTDPRRLSSAGLTQVRPGNSEFPDT